MARGDVRPTKSNYRGGGYSGGSSSYYDDEGRGESKQVWEWFEERFEANPTLTWLLSLDDERCYWLIKASTYRFGLMDIATYSNANSDSRARRLVIKRIDTAAWNAFHKHMVDGYDKEKERIQKGRHESAEQRDREYAAYQAQREAERVRVEREGFEALMPQIDLTVGMLSSDLNQAFVHTDRVGIAGEWLDDVVDAYQGTGGFGYEDAKAVGTKIQITVSLDLSNSMIYNGVSLVAATAFRDIGLTLKALMAEHVDDLNTAFFTFSQDGWGDSDRGKRVQQLQFNPDHRNACNNEYHLAEFHDYRPAVLADSWQVNDKFSGTDTWISPLLSGIQLWESENGDPGAVRLDLVLTDAVLEHAKDIRDADMVQERRNGALTTVLLNFMPEREWLNSTLPKRCYQMHVDADNVSGILRNVISEFVAAHM